MVLLTELLHLSQSVAQFLLEVLAQFMQKMTALPRQQIQCENAFRDRTQTRCHTCSRQVISREMNAQNHIAPQRVQTPRAIEGDY
nr:hypothetical protein [uncultured bacterium]